MMSPSLERMRQLGKKVAKELRVWRKIGKEDGDIKVSKSFKVDPRTITYWGMVVNDKLVLIEPVQNKIGTENEEEQQVRLRKRAIAQGGIIGLVKCVSEPVPVEFMALEDYSEEED